MAVTNEQIASVKLGSKWWYIHSIAENRAPSGNFTVIEITATSVRVSMPDTSQTHSTGFDSFFNLFTPAFKKEEWCLVQARILLQQLQLAGDSQSGHDILVELDI